MIRSRQAELKIITVILGLIAFIATVALIIAVMSPNVRIEIVLICGVIITASLIVLSRLIMSPDQIRADQSDVMLKLASEMLSSMDHGLNHTSAQAVCEKLLASSSAIAVAITDQKCILGYAGDGEEYNIPGSSIRTAATRATIEDGKMRVLYSAKEIGFPDDHNTINAGILVPLRVSNNTVGTLKFYYPNPRDITETQQSIAEGFGELLSTQMAAISLDDQTRIATSMELKALQAQINPHFLFNTLNTIASFTRTDPTRARVLLREFSKFYRSTLENAHDLIPLKRELDQTLRYLQFETARFGEDRLAIATDVDESLGEVLVPAFMIQPLVENAIKHAMPAEGKLTITVSAASKGDNLILTIDDDGVGMDEEKRSSILKPNSSETGLGIAVGNIHDRMKSSYGNESYMHVDSEQGVGTRIMLFLRHGLTPEIIADTAEW